MPELQSPSIKKDQHKCPVYQGYLNFETWSETYSYINKNCHIYVIILRHFLLKVKNNFFCHFLRMPLFQLLCLFGRFAIRIITIQSRNWTTIVLNLGLVDGMCEIPFRNILYPENSLQHWKRLRYIIVRVYQPDVVNQRCQHHFLPFN